MRRKIAFVFTLAVTVLLAVLRLDIVPGWNAVRLGPFNADYILIGIVALSFLVLVALCLSRKEPLRQPTGAWESVGGWICTFSGAVLALSILLDTFSWLVYGQIPPPNNAILNTTDLVTLICTLLFGLAGGIFLTWQGFCWMSRDNRRRSLRSWLALTPVLWLWFRLARYEVSYASTIDIGENFFDFALLIFSVLFFLQFARYLSSIGKPPRSGLLLCALCTVMISLSDAPVTIFGIASGEPLGKLLLAIVDSVIGLFALYMAALQVFAAPPKEEAVSETGNAAVSADTPAEDFDAEEDGLAWTDLPKEYPPLKPPFSMQEIMRSPEAEESPLKPAPEAPDFEVPETVSPLPSDMPDEPYPLNTVQPAATEETEGDAKNTLTVDDLLEEIDNL
ncbi:MAG: hypothetical protein ACI39E_01625 [Acutalibacteraceae bacterium]